MALPSSGSRSDTYGSFADVVCHRLPLLSPRVRLAVAG
jgi:hypothetical protein